MRAICVGLAVMLGVLVPACGLDIYTFGGGAGDDTGDGGMGDDTADGGGTGDGGMIDAAPPDACVGFPETCNGVDDDCDGVADDGFDLTMDPAHCGDCTTRCFQPNAAGTCVASACEYACLPGFLDTDNNVDNGCEYLCTVTNGGIEVCDLADNDCNQLIDDGVDLDNDLENCGGCGNRCIVLNATETCVAGDCGYDECDPNFADLDAAIPGCEYTCPAIPQLLQELCNGVDDDCDGIVDELPIDGFGEDCTDAGFETVGETGECTFGTESCNFGVAYCDDYERPTTEVCNNLDDNCDGTPDETFDKVNDPRYCGGCTACNLPFAIEGCAASACTVVACLPGHVDEDGNPSNGCEYACSPTGPETCDGLDNDCDGDFDDDDVDLAVPADFCRPAGPCGPTAPTCMADPCTSAVGWDCAYPGTVETDSCGNIRNQELLCNNVDGNCNGQTDESYPLKNTACIDSGLGICRGEGSYVCAPSTLDVSCNITSPGEPPGNETCDNEDDDCNGVIDEDAPDDMVTVVNGATTFYMYRYEASRPDATAGLFGSEGHRSCSKQGVMPWRTVSHTEAVAACAAANGKRLCTEAEWALTCGGAAGLRFPYNDTYDPDSCNGRDVDLDCVNPDSDDVAATGEAFNCPLPAATSACVSPGGAVDMSGNLREWTSTPVGSAFRVLGGGYDNIEEGLACDFSFIAFSAGLEFPNLGFRCCADLPDAP